MDMIERNGWPEDNIKLVYVNYLGDIPNDECLRVLIPGGHAFLWICDSTGELIMTTNLGEKIERKQLSESLTLDEFIEEVAINSDDYEQFEQEHYDYKFGTS